MDGDGHVFDLFVPIEPAFVGCVRTLHTLWRAWRLDASQPNPLEQGDASNSSGRGDTCTMPDNLIRAARCHERAVECIKLANASFDEPMEARYRLLAERYIKLAECEEAVGGARAKYCWITSPSTVPIVRCCLGVAIGTASTPPHVAIIESPFGRKFDRAAARSPSRPALLGFFQPANRKEKRSRDGTAKKRRSRDGHGCAKSWVLSDQARGARGGRE
jgi:hypothetical protein